MEDRGRSGVSGVCMQHGVPPESSLSPNDTHVSIMSWKGRPQDCTGAAGHACLAFVGRQDIEDVM